MNLSKKWLLPEKWKHIKSEQGPDLMLFDVRYDWMENPRNKHVFKRIVLETNDWVNIIAITKDKKLVVVHQYRFGSGKVTTEIPAGLVDPGESSLETAKRELLEETGYTSDSWKYLGAIEPNPAFQNNKCHHWLALDVFPVNTQALDDGEDIYTEAISYEEVRARILSGAINHSLALSALSRVREIWNKFTDEDFYQNEKE